MRISIALAATVLVSVLLVAGCGGGKETGPEKLVPAGTNFIAGIRLADVVKDGDFDALFRDLSQDVDDPQTLGDLLDKVTEQSGIDLRQFSDLVLFGDLSTIEEGFGVIAKGSFEEEQIVTAIEKAGGKTLITRDYKGRRIHTEEEEDISFSVLGPSTLVLGNASGSAVESVIDVQEGDSNRASGKVYDALQGLGDVLVRLALEVPPEATDELELPVGDLPLDLAVLKDIDIFRLGVDKDGGTMVVDARVDFTSESSAADAGEAIEAILTLVRVGSLDERIKGLLENVQTSIDRASVTVHFEVSVSELKAVVGGLGEGFQSLFGVEQETAVLEVPAPRVREVPSAPVPAPLAPEAGKRVPIEGEGHVPVGESVSYSTNPPLSGEHWPETAVCGIYDEELPDELVVHNLEHGHVVISYNLPEPDDARRLIELVERLNRRAGDWGILRPYSKIMPGTVAMTAWGVVDQFQGVDEEHIGRFYGAHHANTYSSETAQRGPIPCS